MADGILSDVVGRILEVLASRAFQEIQLASGVKDEILKLKHTVDTINGVLLDAEDQFNQKKDRAVTVWLRRLKDAVYDADDLLDDFHTQLKLNEVMSPGNKLAKEVRIFFSKSNQIAYSLMMDHKIKTTRERLDDIKNDKQFLLFKHDTAGKGVSEREQTHSFVLEEDVIGREDDKNAIIPLLLDANAEHDVSVISILGIGGVGKTTFVQSIYNVEKLKTHFQLRMWVCVSDDFTVKTVVQKILKSASSEIETENFEMDQLQGRLRQQIDGKRYLLVLDDVWNENLDKWLKLKSFLKNGAKGSKILVRSERVGNIMSKPPFIYVLRGLPEDKSWSLFTKVAFEQGKEPKDSRLVAIGKEIVARCVGVPLAIRTLGRLLYRNYKEEDWWSFKDNELSEIAQEESDILPILKLSYDHLSSPLKQCFAYCALFPKDYELKKEELIQLWMAQGFLHASKMNQCLEDVGNEYFMDLLLGSFLQDLEERDYALSEKKVLTCKMHDLMHDLAQSVVGSECKMVTSDEDNVDQRSRHISFAPDIYSLEISTAMVGESRLRTILSLSYGELDEFHFNKILSNFRCLRCLTLSHLGIMKVPTSIGKLKHLRYLNLSMNYFKKLPDSVSKLINLHTLDLTGCLDLHKLPREMRKMLSLQYLIVDDCDSLTSMPRGLGQLTDLRTLPLFVVGKWDRRNEALRELNGLNKLRGRLTIRIYRADLKNVNLAEVNLKEKQYLESISLDGDTDETYDEEMMVEGLKPHPNLKELTVIGSLGSVMFSGCMSSFTNLTLIEISDSRNFRSITPLVQLPSLLSLTLQSLHSVEYISESAGRVSEGSTSTTTTTTATFFSSLKKLSIGYCGKLKGWWKINDDEDDQVITTTAAEKAEHFAFPCLSELEILDCPMLTCMPLYPTLEKLELFQSSTKTLQQTMMMKIKTNTSADADAASTSYSTRPALSNLNSLHLLSINDLESLPELLRRVSSLVKMDIIESPRLISQLPQCITYLSSLEELTIGDCSDGLDFFDDNDDDNQCQWQGLRSLRCLIFDRIETMVCLPKWIHYITTLQLLEIYSCTNLMDLAELQGMQLQSLEILDSPCLKERCGNKKGVEWPNIAHIPNIKIDFRMIQWEGHYQEGRR